jgi:hypothetical protein
MRAGHEPSPFKSVTQQDVDLLYGQICKIPGEYKRIKELGRNPLSKVAFSFVSKISSSPDRQKEADLLAAKATEIYGRDTTDKSVGANPDLWQHEEKQRSKEAVTSGGAAGEYVLISRDEKSMLDVRPVNDIDDLNAEIDKLKQLTSRSGIQNKKLNLLEMQRKIFQSENRVVPEAEIDRYAALAKKYAELLNLLDREFERARAEKGVTVVKKEQVMFGKTQEVKVKQKPELYELINLLNEKPEDDHLLRMISAILKERFSDENRHLFSGIAFHDATGVYQHAAFARREPFKSLVVPEEYSLGLQHKSSTKKL